MAATPSSGTFVRHQLNPYNHYITKIGFVNPKNKKERLSKRNMKDDVFLEVLLCAWFVCGWAIVLFDWIGQCLSSLRRKRKRKD